jgi:hypothetical protein
MGAVSILLGNRDNGSPIVLLGGHPVLMVSLEDLHLRVPSKHGISKVWDQGQHSFPVGSLTYLQSLWRHGKEQCSLVQPASDEGRHPEHRKILGPGMAFALHPPNGASPIDSLTLRHLQDQLRSVWAGSTIFRSR